MAHCQTILPVTVTGSIDDHEYLPDIPLPRRSLDSTCNSHGTKLLELCKSTSLRIANGRLDSDHLVGTYTYACHAGSSVIDYLILSQHDFSHIANFNRFRTEQNSLTLIV